MNEVDFLNKSCKLGEHNSCYGSWVGLGFRVNCECNCHKKNNAADWLGRPDSATSNLHLLEVTNRSD